MAKDEIAYLGSDTIYEGKLSFKGTVRIEGKFKGEITSDGILNIGKDAAVEGTLQVGELLCSGHFTGEVEAKRRIILYSTGIVEGILQTPSLLTEEGAIIQGQINMKKSGKPQGQPAREE